MPRNICLISTLCLSIFAADALAETEDALYGARVPADAVFLRHLGGSNAAVTVFGREFAANDLQGETYTAVSASALYGAEAGRHYTLWQDRDTVEVIVEPTRDDPAKVYLFLLNTDAAPARIVVADGGPVVIDDTAHGVIAARAVNPISVQLAVEHEDTTEAFDLVLRQGTNLTFLVSDGAVEVLEHRFGPVLTDD